MHSTQTLSLYFFNEPRNYMQVKLDTAKTLPKGHQTTLTKRPLCCQADTPFAPADHSFQSHEKKIKMFKKLNFIWISTIHCPYN